MGSRLRGQAEAGTEPSLLTEVLHCSSAPADQTSLWPIAGFAAMNFETPGKGKNILEWDVMAV
jgi:hypothetical protein